MSNERTEYVTHPIVCDTGVYAHYKNPDSEVMLLVCKHSANAELICEIMNADSADEVYGQPDAQLSRLEIDRANVIGYIDDKYKVKSLVINDGPYDNQLTIDLCGFGRFSKFNATESITILDLKGDNQIKVNRKFLGITLWTTVYQ